MKELQGKDKKYDECLKEKEKELKCLLVSSVTDQTITELPKLVIMEVEQGELNREDEA